MSDAGKQIERIVKNLEGKREISSTILNVGIPVALLFLNRFDELNLRLQHLNHAIQRLAATQ